MKIADLAALSFGALARHRLRTVLSLLGVAIGVAAVVVLTALGEGARRYVQGQFESIGSNLVIVIPGKIETAGAIPGIVPSGVPNDLTLGDAQALARALPQVELVVPVAVGNETVSHRERRRQVAVFGATKDLLEARRLAVRSGEFLPEMDPDRAAPIAVLGAQLARELFRDENPLGEVVRVGDVRTRVIGVLEPRGVQLGMDMDDLVAVPVASAMRLFNRSSLFRILLQVRARSEVEEVKRRVIEILAERHGEEDVTCLTQDSVSGGLTAILGVLTLALAGIAGISLTVAGVGILNVMLVSVSERTSEVGLLRALGARRRQVFALFLVEAAVLAGSGGAVGVALSSIAIRTFALAYPAFPAEVPPWAVAAAMTLATAFGAAFGVLPASRASRLDPVLALARR